MNGSRAALLPLVVLLCAFALLAPHSPALRGFAVRSELPPALRPVARGAHTLCGGEACGTCATHCVDYAHVQRRLAACERALPFTAAVWPWDAYMQCVGDECVPHFFDEACGLLPRAADGEQRAHAQLLQTLAAETRGVRGRVQQLREQTRSFFHTMQIDDRMQQYHREALEHIERCDRLFVHALGVRAQYSKLVQYVQSVDYRVIRQEVTRLNFENDDFGRHVRFWKRHNDTLQLVVRTSPEALKHARDALFSEMRQYETDALLIKALRNGSYSKEKQARFSIRLRRKVRKQLAQLRERNAMARREAHFISDARGELYNLLHSVWQRMSARRLNVSCGANALSDAVSLAFQAEREPL